MVRARSNEGLMICLRSQFLEWQRKSRQVLHPPVPDYCSFSVFFFPSVKPCNQLISTLQLLKLCCFFTHHYWFYILRFSISIYHIFYFLILSVSIWLLIFEPYGLFLYFSFIPIIQERLPESFESSDVLNEKTFWMTLFVSHGVAYHNFKCPTKMLPIWHQYTEKAASVIRSTVVFS